MKVPTADGESGGKGKMADDTFHIEIREDGIYLEALEGADYSLPSVVGYLKSCGVENYDSELIGILNRRRKPAAGAESALTE